MKKAKKGFTLVELLVVIAIIAVLATVSIVGYTSFVKKANLSNDQTTINMINDVLRGAEILDRPENLSETLDTLRAHGFSYEKMVPYSSDYDYCYAAGLNRFVLLDDDANVVYPKDAKDVDKATLWAPYKDHATSLVDGVSNYYATRAVTSQQEFDSAFASGDYVLDLNRNVCTVNGRSNVKANNGRVTLGGFADGSSANPVSASNGDNTVTTKDAQGKITSKVYTGVLNPAGVSSQATNNLAWADGATVKYVDCVFTAHTGYYQNGIGLNVTFENCLFVDISNFSLTLQPGNDIGNTSVVTFEGCQFINCNRGINFNGWEYTTLNVNNCYFALKTGHSAYNCIQISSYGNDEYLASAKINFTNNEVASANGVVYFHDEMVGPQNLEAFKAILANFSGNTYADNVAKIADRGEYHLHPTHLLHVHPEYMETLATLIK